MRACWAGGAVYDFWSTTMAKKQSMALLSECCEPARSYINKSFIYHESGMVLEITDLEMLDLYLEQGYGIYMDNYYNSLKLSQKLRVT
jgi:hypothetical protein